MLNIKTKLRRAFTIVELVVVIAVIAALAAILIPTFANVISAANESADQQAVKNMNTALNAEEKISGSKPDSPEAAMKIIEEAGYNVENYIAQSSDNTLYYDWTENRVLIWTVNSNGTGSVTYPSDMAETYSSVDGIAANWYTLNTAYNTYAAATTSELENVIATAMSSTATSGEEVIIEVTASVELSSSVSLANASGTHVTLDLNNNELTLTCNATSDVSDGSTLYIKDGTVSSTYTGTDKYGYNTIAALNVKADSSITLENVTLNTEATAIYPQGNAAQVNIINSTIISNGVYGVATNAATPNNYGVYINIENSTIISQATADYDNVAVLINTPGTLNITDSVLQGDRQGLVVRGGTAVVTNTTITCTGKYNANSYYTSSNWGGGTEVPMGALIVGNRNTSYKYTTSCTLQNVTLNASTSSNSNNQLVYMYSSNGYQVDLVYSGCNFSNSDINGKGNSDTNGAGGCYINGTLVS